MNDDGQGDINERRWEAVRRSDGAACGPFIYAVSTTGIYCRPGCSSRLPLKRNVVFFDTVADAEAAGFRPCKRCRPDRSATGGEHEAAIRRACALIARSEEPPALEELAHVAGLSTSRFRRVFKDALGVTPKQYAKGLRRSRLQDSLTQTDSVTHAIYTAGFNSPSRVYEHTDELLGMTPSTYHEGGPGQSIRYATGDCSLGRVLVGVTRRGVCAIELGDDDDELVSNLSDRFSAAELAQDDTLGETLRLVVAFIEHPSLSLTLPLDVQGTAFQQRVWQALQTIPVGETRSYRQIAELIGSPSSARAVAAACGKNKLAVAVPCHRVISSDGRLTGYRWGIERKQALLSREGGGD